MDFQMHLKILRRCKTRNITQGALIRNIYELIRDHKGKDFKDLDDLFTKLYPKASRNKRESPFYDTPIQDLEKEAEESDKP